MAREGQIPNQFHWDAFKEKSGVIWNAFKEKSGVLWNAFNDHFFRVFLCTYMSISFYNVISLQFLHVLKAFRAF